jgi:hypothetical protein
MLSSLQWSAQSRTRWVVSSGCDVVLCLLVRAELGSLGNQSDECSVRCAMAPSGDVMIGGRCKARARQPRSFVRLSSASLAGSMHMYVHTAAKNVVYVCLSRLPLTAGHVLVTGWPRACVRAKRLLEQQLCVQLRVSAGQRVCGHRCDRSDTRWWAFVQLPVLFVLHCAVSQRIFFVCSWRSIRRSSNCTPIAFCLVRPWEVNLLTTLGHAALSSDAAAW